MKPVTRHEILVAAEHIDTAMRWLDMARSPDIEFRIAIDHIVDDQKLLVIVDRLRQLAEEPVS